MQDVELEDWFQGIWADTLMHLEDGFELPYAGGCDLGTRTVEPHMSALRPFGLDVKATDGAYHASVNRAIEPERPIVLTERGDTVTENALMAAALHPGTTVIRNASSNYMVQDLCFYLRKLGVDVEGIGTTRQEVLPAPDVHRLRLLDLHDRLVAQDGRQIAQRPEQPDEQRRHGEDLPEGRLRGQAEDLGDGRLEPDGEDERRQDHEQDSSEPRVRAALVDVQRVARMQVREPRDHRRLHPREARHDEVLEQRVEPGARPAEAAHPRDVAHGPVAADDNLEHHVAREVDAHRHALPA